MHTAHTQHAQHPHGHSHGHDCFHEGGHGHTHSHAPKTFGRAFAVAVLMNVLFTLLEGGVGLGVNSVALLADAGHNFSDIMGLLLAWGAYHMARRKPTLRYTYGFGQVSVWAALFNGALLLLAVGVMLAEAWSRLTHPMPVPGGVVMAVAAVGIVINGVSAWMLMGDAHDVNMKGAYWHMLADALVSAVVVLGGGLMLLTGWMWVDALSSMLIGGVIVWGSVRLLLEAAQLSLLGAPARVSVAEVQAFLAQCPKVAAVHDVHVWGLSAREVAMTCHLVMPQGHPGDAFLRDLAEHMREDFGIGHVTVQVETHPNEACGLHPPCNTGPDMPKA